MSVATRHASLSGAQWNALGTSVVLRVTDADALHEARELLAREIELIDRVASRFRDDSELALVNRAAGRLTRIGPHLYEALSVALRAARLSDGLLDPTIGASLIAAGYDRDRSQLPAPPPQHAQTTARVPGLQAPIRRFSWRDVGLLGPAGHASAMVRTPMGLRLDLGATAKALAADRAALLIARQTGSGVLVSLGGDIATAGPAPDGGWLVHVTDDHRSTPDAPGQTVSIICGALATSSTTALRWTHHGREMHHIIDPRTGSPARSPWRTVSVTAGDCVDANIATTTAIILGADAPLWLAQRGLSARLVNHEGSVHTVGGWPQEGERT